MSRQFAFPVFGAVAALLSFSAIPTSSGSAAETCIAAPNAPAPQGSHWYYRLERATQRKCWRLVKLDREPQGVAKQAAAAPEPDEEDAAPVAQRSGGPQHGWLTRSASAVPETPAPTQSTPEPADDQAAAPPPVPGAQEQAIEAAAPVAPVQAAEPKQPNVAVQDPVVAASGPGMTQFVFLAIAGIGLFAAAIFFVVGLRRRRSDVLTRIARDDITSFEAPEAEDAPTFSAMPPMRLMPQHDDVDEALQRRTRRRRMAA
ncbi:MAG: hypothetical protein QOF14_2250 [Hyphomicrobiales bacterium]|jgi:hypothetical protein|nr:hypothetical protein [Hyphomicrobiales bacterium]